MWPAAGAGLCNPPGQRRGRYRAGPRRSGRLATFGLFLFLVRPALLARIPFLLVVLLPLLLFLVPPGRHLRSPAGTMPGIDRLCPRA